MDNRHGNSAQQPPREGLSRGLCAGMLMVLSLALLAPQVRAEISEKLDYTDYPVPASEEASLGRSLNRNSPIRHDGLTYHAYTTWTVNWTYRWTDAGGYCRISEVATQLHGIIKLPRLEGGSESLRGQFDRYLQALHQHELGHYQIGRKAALEVDRELRALPVMANCQRLSAAANRIAHQVVDRHKEEERTYDLITVHGRLQGARLDL
ncbi:DUF922 domain-containing protein [Pseudomonas oryzae]|uniref:Predicted secreted Zn-dependent protease n=1 Tax=Pseudomonas oryzae TaxID=1392877 RepID=A0A1H1SAV2_9PSED|nr:DUF922 domain-containing protein [Pseudomonas oryzae]SDS45094.1 Predicted secreted Zn-dependent protease [Pseudomonas oryzae]